MKKVNPRVPSPRPIQDMGRVSSRRGSHGGDVGRTRRRGSSLNAQQRASAPPFVTSSCSRPKLMSIICGGGSRLSRQTSRKRHHTHFVTPSQRRKLTRLIELSFASLRTGPPAASWTSNTSTNHPPSELIRALVTPSPSSVKCCTTCAEQAAVQRTKQRCAACNAKRSARVRGVTLTGRCQDG